MFFFFYFLWTLKLFLKFFPHFCKSFFVVLILTLLCRLFRKFAFQQKHNKRPFCGNWEGQKFASFFTYFHKQTFIKHMHTLSLSSSIYLSVSRIHTHKQRNTHTHTLSRTQYIFFIHTQNAHTHTHSFEFKHTSTVIIFFSYTHTHVNANTHPLIEQ